MGFIKGFMQAWETEFLDLSERLQYLKESHQIDYAVGTDLDNIANFLGLERLTQEIGNDEKFRTRIKSYVITYQGGGTSDAFNQSFLQKYGVRAKAFDTTPVPTVNVLLNVEDMGGVTSMITVDEITQTIIETKAAGVGYVYSFYIEAGDETDKISFISDTAIAVIGGGGYLIWDIGNWDEKLWNP